MPGRPRFPGRRPFLAVPLLAGSPPPEQPASSPESRRRSCCEFGSIRDRWALSKHRDPAACARRVARRQALPRGRRNTRCRENGSERRQSRPGVESVQSATPPSTCSGGATSERRGAALRSHSGWEARQRRRSRRGDTNRVSLGRGSSLRSGSGVAFPCRRNATDRSRSRRGRGGEPGQPFWAVSLFRPSLRR